MSFREVKEALFCAYEQLSLTREASDPDITDLLALASKITNFAAQHGYGAKRPASDSESESIVPPHGFISVKEFVRQKNISESFVYTFVKKNGQRDYAIRVGSNLFIDEAAFMDAIKDIPRVKNRIEKGVFFFGGISDE